LKGAIRLPDCPTMLLARTLAVLAAALLGASASECIPRVPNGATWSIKSWGPGENLVNQVAFVDYDTPKDQMEEWAKEHFLVCYFRYQTRR
jgi:hypothetical protein